VAVARLANLPVADKPESMELCFVPNGKLRFNLSRPIRAKRGSAFSKQRGRK